MSTLKLPKDVVADARHEAISRLLTTNTSTLWERGRLEVPTLAAPPALLSELERALRFGQATQGLETIAEHLAREQKGLDALAKKVPDEPQRARVSRILFMANDGSTRFFRDCDSLLDRYAQRLLGCRLDLTGEAMGAALVGGPKLVRAVLVHDKKAAARVLLALVAPGEGTQRG